MTVDKAIEEVYSTFYFDGVLKTFEKTGYTKNDFYSALVLAYGENIAGIVYDVFILDAVKSGYCN